MGITINGVEFNGIPCMCGVCPWYSDGGYSVIDKTHYRGFCSQFRKRKRRYDNIPSRCRKLFEKGFAIGGDLVIVIKD